MERLYLQEDYFIALEQIMDAMMRDAETKAVSDIKEYAIAKNLSEAKKAKELIEIPNQSMVSEYYPWIRKIAGFLKKHPDIAEQIEHETGTADLFEFFV